MDHRAVLAVPVFELKAELFRALAHPARVRALEVLAGGERSVGDLAIVVGIDASHLSHHLGILRRAGLVSTREEGFDVVYKIKDPVLVQMLSAARRLLLTSLSEARELVLELESTETV